ncbi:hypothetical protein AXW83_23790 [Bosea sp. PAMC 26642]|nr:hypothetical protein AXW83_23790 [Bosea sp. PAMC 26642]
MAKRDARKASYRTDPARHRYKVYCCFEHEPNPQTWLPTALGGVLPATPPLQQRISYLGDG